VERFTFFWGGVYSQWYKSSFRALVPVYGSIKERIFNCAEQYMMYMKAAEFGDWEIAEQIMLSTNPKEQKALGRKVRNFDAARWNEIARTIVFHGNVAKFTQNAGLGLQLLSTRSTSMVEASPMDRVWGIGLAATDTRAHDRRTWQGKNWLGETLDRVREYIEIKEGIK
jgi:ribA/ribD-fused uncharacterized protein